MIDTLWSSFYTESHVFLFFFFFLLINLILGGEKCVCGGWGWRDKIKSMGLAWNINKSGFFSEREKKRGGGAKIKSMILVWNSDKIVTVLNLPWFIWNKLIKHGFNFLCTCSVCPLINTCTCVN